MEVINIKEKEKELDRLLLEKEFISREIRNMTERYMLLSDDVDSLRNMIHDYYMKK